MERGQRLDLAVRVVQLSYACQLGVVVELDHLQLTDAAGQEAEAARTEAADQRRQHLPRLGRAGAGRGDLRLLAVLVHRLVALSVRVLDGYQHKQSTVSAMQPAG